jgi:hypothetical protein
MAIYIILDYQRKKVSLKICKLSLNKTKDQFCKRKNFWIGDGNDQHQQRKSLLTDESEEIEMDDIPEL